MITIHPYQQSREPFDEQQWLHAKNAAALLSNTKSAYLFLGFGKCCMRRMSLLPQEFSGSYKWLRMLEFPSLTSNTSRITLHNPRYPLQVATIICPGWKCKLIAAYSAICIAPLANKIENDFLRTFIDHKHSINTKKQKKTSLRQS